jgi:hypothetical protein
MNIERVNMVRQLVRVGNIAYPDHLSVGEMSAGADFLDSAALHLMEAIEYGRIVPDQDFCADGEHRSDVLQEIASESVPAYVHEKWGAFVDLCAYESEWSDDESGITMDDMADGRLARVAYVAMSEWLAEHLDTED